MQNMQHKRLAKRIVARFDPTWLGEPTSTAAVLPPVVATPDPTTESPTSTPPVTTSETPVAPAPTTTSTPAAPQTTATPTTSSVPVTTEQPTTALVASTTPVTTAAVSTTPQVVVRPTTTTTPRVTPTVVRTTASASVRGGVTVTQTLDATPTASESAAAENTGNVGTIVGAVAGSLVGLVVLVAFVSWIIRKHNKRGSDDFNRQSYLRNSMMIPDEPAARPVIGTQAALALARSNNNMGPRPPSMLERKPTYMMPNGQPSPSFAPGQVISFDPGQFAPAPHASSDGPYPSPMAFAAYTPPAQHHQSELSRRPSGAQLLTRQPTNGAAHDPAYAHAPSPGGYSAEYHNQSPGGYNDGYTYPMHPGFAAERGMVQSVTPFQAQQYAEITRALEGPDFAATHESFHPISPVPASPVAASPVGQAISDENHSQFAPSSTHGEKAMPNPFAEHSRVDSTPPSLPPFENLSRTGTPIDPNPQHAHWSYDAKGQAEGHRLSVAGMPAPVVQPPTMPPAAHTREERTVVVGNGEELKAKRPVSVVDTDDAYGGM